MAYPHNVWTYSLKTFHPFLQGCDSICTPKPASPATRRTWKHNPDSVYNGYCPPFVLPFLSVSFLPVSLIMLSIKVPCELARYAGATAPASCQRIPLKPLYIRKLAGFFKCLFYFRLKIQYIFYIYGWFSQLYFCQYPALPEKNNWLSEMLFLFPVFQPAFPVIFTQDIFLFPDIPTGFFSGLFCFWLAFWLVFPHSTWLSGWKQAGIFLQIPATHYNL